MYHPKISEELRNDSNLFQRSLRVGALVCFAVHIRPLVTYFQHSLLRRRSLGLSRPKRVCEGGYFQQLRLRFTNTAYHVTSQTVLLRLLETTCSEPSSLATYSPGLNYTVLGKLFARKIHTILKESLAISANNFSRTVPSFATAHTFCASRDDPRKSGLLRALLAKIDMFARFITAREE